MRALLFKFAAAKSAGEEATRPAFQKSEDLANDLSSYAADESLVSDPPITADAVEQQLEAMFDEQSGEGAQRPLALRALRLATRLTARAHAQVSRLALSGDSASRVCRAKASLARARCVRYGASRRPSEARRSRRSSASCARGCTQPSPRSLNKTRRSRVSLPHSPQSRPGWAASGSGASPSSSPHLHPYPPPHPRRRYARASRAPTPPSRVSAF